jgi:hypothetical protein
MRRAARDDVDRRGAGLAHAGKPSEGAGVGIEHPGERAEPGDQALRQRLDVAPLDRRHQQVFEHLVVAERRGPALEQALAQAGALARIIGRPARGLFREQVARFCHFLSSRAFVAEHREGLLHCLSLTGHASERRWTGRTPKSSLPPLCSCQGAGAAAGG